MFEVLETFVMRSFQYRHKGEKKRLPCWLLYVLYLNVHKSSISIMNSSKILGFFSELDKPIHVNVISMWCIHMFVDRLLNVKGSVVSNSVRSLMYVYQNTRRHISDNRQ